MAWADDLTSPLSSAFHRCGGDIGAEEVVDWLLLHLKEEDLPAAFDPRGRHLDVVVHKKEEGQGEGLGRTYGLREPDCKVLMEIMMQQQQGKGGEATALQALGNAIYRAIGISSVDGNDDDLMGPSIRHAAGEDNGMEMSFDEELEALKAIYGDEHCHIIASSSSGDWRPRVLRLTGGLEDGQSLHVWLTAGYPGDASLPLALLSGPKASSRVQVSRRRIGTGRLRWLMSMLSVFVFLTLQLALGQCALPLRGHAMLYELLLAAIDALAVKIKGPAPSLLIQDDASDVAPPPSSFISQPQPPPAPPSTSLTSSSASSTLSSFDRKSGSLSSFDRKSGQKRSGNERRRYVRVVEENHNDCFLLTSSSPSHILGLPDLLHMDFGVEVVYQIMTQRFKLK